MLNLDIPFSLSDAKHLFGVTKFGGVEVGLFRNIVSAGKDVACEFILSQMPPKNCSYLSTTMR
jgi:hypothetical protein